MCVSVFVCGWGGGGMEVGVCRHLWSLTSGKGRKQKPEHQKNFSFYPQKRTWEIFFFFFQIYNRLKHDKKTPIIKSELII